MRLTLFVLVLSTLLASGAGAGVGKHDGLQIEWSPKRETVWAKQAYQPEAGHVYWQEVKSHGQTMTVMYRINEIQRDKIKLTFSIVKPLEGPEMGAAMAGTMGQCGGAHASR